MSVDVVMAKFRGHLKTVIDNLPTRSHLKDYLWIAEEKGLELPMQWENYDIYGLRRLVIFNEESEFNKMLRARMRNRKPRLKIVD